MPMRAGDHLSDRATQYHDPASRLEILNSLSTRLRTFSISAKCSTEYRRLRGACCHVISWESWKSVRQAFPPRMSAETFRLQERLLQEEAHAACDPTPA